MYCDQVTVHKSAETICGNTVSLVTFALSIIYTYWTLEDARVKKDQYSEKMLLGCCSFFTQRFLNVFGSSGPRWGTLRLNLTQPSKFHQTRILYCTRRIDRLRPFSNTWNFSRFLFSSKFKSWSFSSDSVIF